MVAGDGVQHFWPGFAVALGQFGADLRVAAFHLVIGRLADVVQQAAAARQRAVEADLVRHEPGSFAHQDLTPLLGIAHVVTDNRLRREIRLRIGRDPDHAHRQLARPGAARKPHLVSVS